VWESRTATELATTSRPALPADEIAAAIALLVVAIALLERHGYTVTRP